MTGPNHVLIARLRKQGFGEGEGAHYQPWITVRRSRSHGVVTRFKGGVTGRIHHLLSLRELRCQLLLEWSEDVLDIREQFPLHPIEETREIATSLGYRHPRARVKTPEGNRWFDMVMTTDFRVRLATPTGSREIMLSVKPNEELADERVLQKLEIERTYAERRGIPWYLVTDHELPIELTDNLRLVLKYRVVDELPVPQAELHRLLDELFLALSVGQGLSVACRDMDRRLGLKRGSALAIAWHAIATRTWLVDLSVKLDPQRPLPGLRRGPLSLARGREVA